MRIRKALQQILRACPSLAVFAAILLTINILGFGQAVTGRLVGSVQDATKAAVPKAQIIITNQATGITSTLSSDTQGNYVAPLLPPGTYQIEVEMAGFKKDVSTSNVVNVDQTTQIGRASCRER